MKQFPGSDPTPTFIFMQGIVLGTKNKENKRLFTQDSLLKTTSYLKNQSNFLNYLASEILKALRPDDRIISTRFFIEYINRLIL